MQYKEECRSPFDSDRFAIFAQAGLSAPFGAQSPQRPRLFEPRVAGDPDGAPNFA